MLPMSMPGGTKVVKLASPPQTLPALLAATRKNKLGVAAAVQAAIMLVTREMAPEGLAKQDYSTVAFFDHRKYLKKPYTDTGAWPMGVWMIGLPISQPEGDFATTARDMQAIYGQDMSVDECSALSWYDGFCARMVQLLSSPMPEGVPPPTQPQLSSIGPVDGKVKTQYQGKISFGVKSVEIILDNMAASIMVFQWYDISLFHNILYGPACVPRRLVESMKRNLHAVTTIIERIHWFPKYHC